MAHQFSHHKTPRFIWAENYTGQLRWSWELGEMLCHGPQRQSNGYHGLQGYWRRHLAERLHNNRMAARLSRQSWSEIVAGGTGWSEEVNKANKKKPTTLSKHIYCDIHLLTLPTKPVQKIKTLGIQKQRTCTGKNSTTIVALTDSFHCCCVKINPLLWEPVFGNSHMWMNQ